MAAINPATQAQRTKVTSTDLDCRNGVIHLLNAIGEDPEREGLRETPARFVKALWEMTRGYQQNPAEILATQFSEKCDELILLKGIRFTSLCEHHLLPFVGTATVGYLPSDKVVGLSKLARLVKCFSKRLQIQERLTYQIAEAIMQHCNARGAGVVITAQHQCMACRGVEQLDAEMVTSSMLGFLREDTAARSEFLYLVG